MTVLERNVLVDGNNLIHRSHAVFVKSKSPEELMSSPSGYPTGFIYGIFSMLSDWVSEISNPTRMVFFLDGRPARKLALDPDYKRKDDAEARPGSVAAPLRLSDGFEAATEMDVVTHLLSLLGVDVYHHPDEEADDLIASYVQQHSESMNVVISSDTDFYQMLAWSDRIILFRPGTGPDRFYDAEKAEEHLLKKFKVRVPPENVRMFKALTGDSSDGIVGIPRVRKKVIAPLCRHSSVEDLYASGLPGLSKAEREKAEALKERIRVNYELIGLNGSIDLSTALVKASPDFEAASRILRDDLGMTTVFPHSFQLGQGPRVRISAPTTDLLPDFLRDLV